MIVGERVHLFEFGRDRPACPEYRDMVAVLRENAVDYAPEEFVRRALAVGFSYCTGNEYPNLPLRDIVLVDYIAVGILEFLPVERRVEDLVPVTLAINNKFRPCRNPLRK